MATHFSNARWVALSQGARVASQLVSMTVLARLLAPDAYGLMALAAIVTNLAYLFRDMGTGAALIQAAVVAPRMASTVHWTNVALGLTIGVCVVCAGPLAARLFHEPQLAMVLVLLAVVFPITGASVVHQALLERDSRFAVVAGAEIAAALAGLATALLLAWRSAGVFSLVAQMVVASAVSSGLLVLRSPFRPERHWNLAEFKAIARFSGNLSLFNVVLYVSRNADSMVVGRLLGTALLGVYAMAYRLMLFPLQNMTFVASRVLFPVMSRQQASARDVAALYLRSLAFIAFLTAPLMAGLFALREPFVHVMLGARWQGTVTLLAWLAPVGFIQSLVSSTGTLLMARGSTDLMLRLGLVGAALQVGAVVAGARWGIEGVAAAYLAANAVNAVPALYFSARLVDLGLGALARSVAPAVAAALVMVGVLRVTAPLLAHALDNALAALLVQVAIGVLAYGAASLVLLRPQLLSLRALVGFHKKAEA